MQTLLQLDIMHIFNLTKVYHTCLWFYSVNCLELNEDQATHFLSHSDAYNEGTLLKIYA